MKSSKTIFVCRECGETSHKWLGRCPECQTWNTFDEIEVRESVKGNLISKNQRKNQAEKLSLLKIPEYIRTKTGMNELDRVLGGGLVDSSVVLLSGEARYLK